MIIYTIGISLLDLSTTRVPSEFEIYTPFYLYLIEPLIGISDYFTSFYNIKSQLIAWFVWIFIFCVIVTLIHKRPIWKVIPAYLTSILWFIIFITFVLFFSIPKYYLKAKNSHSDFLLLDFHSHSYYSHDGIPTLIEAINWHKKNGFDAFYLTDHGRNPGISTFIKMSSQQNHKCIVLPGEEIQDLYGNHLLILGLEKTVSETLEGKETKEIVDFVHKYNGAVIVAHWWGQKATTLEKLYNAGVDGFEIYGREITPLDKKTQSELIKFTKDKKLVAIAGTNWHGWGSSTDLWNIVKIPSWKNYTPQELNKKIIELIRNKSTDSFRVITLSKNSTPQQLIFFEPFVGLFLYFSNLNFYQIIIWAIWIICIYKIVKLRIFRQNLHLLYFIVAVLFLIFALTQFSKWLIVKDTNELLLVLTKIYVLLSVIFSFTGYIKLTHLKRVNPFTNYP